LIAWELGSNFAEFQTFVVRVAVLTMKPVVPDPDIRPRLSIAELNAAHAAFEAANVVKKPQTFYDHRCTSSEFLFAVRALFLAADTEHPVLTTGLTTDAGGHLGTRALVTIGHTACASSAVICVDVHLAHVHIGVDVV